MVVAASGTFTLVELIGDEDRFEVNDEVIGDWETNGSEELTAADGTRVDAYVKGTWPTLPDAIAGARR